MNILPVLVSLGFFICMSPFDSPAAKEKQTDHSENSDTIRRTAPASGSFSKRRHLSCRGDAALPKSFFVARHMA